MWNCNCTLPSYIDGVYLILSVTLHEAIQFNIPDDEFQVTSIA